MTRAERRAWMLILLSVLVGGLGHRLAPLPSEQPGSAPLVVDVNHASLEELLLLPGVGPTRAKAIIEHRPYQNVEDLVRVPGIGPQTLKKLRPYVRVGKPANTP